MASGPNHWWKNWPATFGYISPRIFFPQSRGEIATAIQTLKSVDQSIKATGGGWSFSDAVLPFQTQAEVDAVSIQKLGANATENLSNVLQGLNGSTHSPMDLIPETIDSELIASMHYNQESTTQEVSLNSGLPVGRNTSLIDMRGLASSLQSQLPSLLSNQAQEMIRAGTFYFHVEAGITMADLDKLLDHQSPRLAVQASGGSPGATLAGTLSTATHGGEFQWPLLVDRVRAIHLVGPGGEEWWIEGAHSIVDQGALAKLYPELDEKHFVGAAWNALPGLTPQDVLNAVIVSMGAIGVIYSVVLEVVPQFGLQQSVTFTNWSKILGAANTSDDILRRSDVAANASVLNVLLDGTLNGTGISKRDNVYADLAINPFTQECWITNRKVTPQLPLDSNSATAGVGDFLSAISQSLGSHATDTVNNSRLLGRVFDFLGWATDVPSINLSDDINDLNQAGTLTGFLTKFPDILTVSAATIIVQAVANVVNNSKHPHRGQQFLGDLLTGVLNALQGTAGANQLGDLVAGNCRFWTGDFSGGGDDQILFYHPGDGHWFRGTFNGGSITWSFASDTTAGTNKFGDLVAGGCLFFTGNFNGGAADQILFYHPGDGHWFLGTFAGNSINWGFASDTTAGANQFGDLVAGNCRFWTGDFSGGGDDQILFYHPGDGHWFRGTFNGGSITWSFASDTTAGTNKFGDLVAGGCLFFTGNFNGGAADQILFYHPGDGHWFLGTFAGNSINWGFASDTTAGANQFGDLVAGNCRFWTGDFSGGGDDQILFYHPGDGHWFRGTFNGGSITWSFASDTTAGTNKFGDLVAGGCLFFTGNFNGGAADQILFYHPGDGHWFLGTFAGNSINWGFASDTTAGANKFGDLVAGNCRFWTGDFSGGGDDQILFYHPGDGHWFRGTFNGGSITWSFASDTTAGMNLNSNRTDISYKVGAVGWPDDGIPGRGLEIALDPNKAFSFLQNVLLDDVVKNTMVGANKPLLGYISVRICPPTSTLMGMQQFSPFSVMIEVVGYRSPESNVVMDTIQAKTIGLTSGHGLGAMLHWGLENDALRAADLANTPLNNPIRPGSALTKLAAFKAVRQYFLNGHIPCFENNFINRLGL